MRITPPLAAYCLLLTSACALTDPWGVNVQQHTAVQRTYKQGESWTMQVTLRHGLRPLDLTGATAIFYWYTNAAQNVWWQRPAEITSPKAGLVTAQWTPAMDTGAASYPYWIGIWASGSTSPLWRVTGTIRMLPSPGFTPNTLPLPARSIDFSEISFTNAPWATPADLQAASNALAGAVQPLGPRLALIESNTSRWDAAWSWGPHFAAGYLLPADLAPYATTQQVATAVSGKLDAAASNATLCAEWFPDVYGTGEGHLRIVDTSTDEAVYLGPLGFGQWRRADGENPSEIDRFVNWYDVPERWEIAAASNNLTHVIGVLKAADVGALPSAGEPAGLAIEWKVNVYPERLLQNPS